MKVFTLAAREAEPLDSANFSGQGTLSADARCL